MTKSLTKEIEMTHAQGVLLKFGDHSLYITPYDFTSKVRFDITSNGKNALGMIIKPILENRIDLEIKK